MSTAPPTTLEEIIRDSGEGWLIDWFAPTSGAVDSIRSKLQKVEERARERGGADVPDFSDQGLLNWYTTNPQGLRAFLQVLGGASTPEMLLMAWRVTQGWLIRRVELRYEKEVAFEVRVWLEPPEGDFPPDGEFDKEPYISHAVGDFKLFRHVGALEVNRRPVLDGFYPLNLC